MKCEWDGNTDDVKLTRGEWLCVHCRAVIGLQAILSAVPE